MNIEYIEDILEMKKDTLKETFEETPPPSVPDRPLMYTSLHDTNFAKSYDSLLVVHDSGQGTERHSSSLAASQLDTDPTPTQVNDTGPTTSSSTNRSKISPLPASPQADIS